MLLQIYSVWENSKLKNEIGILKWAVMQLMASAMDKLVSFLVLKDLLSHVIDVVVFDDGHVFVQVELKDEWRGVGDYQVGDLVVVELGQVLHHSSEHVLVSGEQNLLAAHVL